MLMTYDDYLLEISNRNA